MKKLIYINSVDGHEISGQGSFERNFISFLDGLGVDFNVKIFTINSSRNIITDRIVSLKLNKSSKRSYIWYQIKLCYFLLLEVLVNRKVSVYIRLAPFNLVPFFIASLFRIKITVRSGPIYQNLSLYNKVSNSFLLVLFKYVLAYYYKKSCDIIVVTEKIKETLLGDFRLSSSKIHVISNPINDSIFESEVDVTEIKRANGIESGDKVIGYVGDIYKEQGVQNILEAIALLRENRPIDRIKVLIVGSGSYLNECKRIVKDLDLQNNVMFTGRVEPNKVIEYINVFDICIAPFTKIDYDTKGSSALKVLEYLYCNKPVVTIDVLEYKFIGENVFGFLYEIDNIHDLSRKINLGLNLKSKIISKDYVKKYYSKNEIFSKYLKIIDTN
jgi:glycosyltransferase involved in cell wall biosynthesis